MNFAILTLLLVFIIANRRDIALSTLLFWYMVQCTLSIVIYSPGSLVYALDMSWFFVINASVCYWMKLKVKDMPKNLNNSKHLRGLDIILTSSIYLNLLGILDLVLLDSIMELNYNMVYKGAAFLTMLEVWYLLCLSRNGLHASCKSFINTFKRNYNGDNRSSLRYTGDHLYLGLGKQPMAKA